MVYKYTTVNAVILTVLMVPGCFQSKKEEASQECNKEMIKQEPSQKKELQQQINQEKKNVTNNIPHDRGVIEIKSTQQFDELLKEGRKLIADFYAPWCGPCQKAKPVFKDLAHKYPDITFVALSADEAGIQEIFNRYDIPSFPHFIFIDEQGNIVAREKGFNSKEMLENKIADFAKKMVQP